MIRPLIPVAAFLLILFLFLYPFQFGLSVTPGWHTIVYPRYFILTTIAAVVLLFVIIGYWILSRKSDKINRLTFVLHFLISIGAGAFIKFPGAFLFVNPNNFEIPQIAMRRLSWLPLVCALFIAAQILFFIYFLRTVKTTKEDTIPK